MKYEELRERYPEFSFDGYEVRDNEGKIEVIYFFTQSEDIQFFPSWVLPFSYDEYIENENKDFIDKLIFNLGMSELVSYWKACCSPKVIVRCGYLDDNQQYFWKKLYFNGLGEFFYRNEIDADFESFVNFECLYDDDYVALEKPVGVSGNLIAVGGGKDSVVSLELLKDYDNTCYIINPHGANIDTAKVAGYTDEKIIAPKRKLDRKIVELNSKGYLNGHTPLSAVIAFSAYLCAFLSKKRYIVLSNESSANESYVTGKQVNHQYSKSIEFENDFRSYTKDFLDFGCEYFSLLRPLNEWRIVKEFVKHPKYFDAFCSCNLGSKGEEWNWCGDCSKCLYVYIMLSPFIEKDRLVSIFGKDMFSDENMLAFLDGLVSTQFDKPFECIGTRDEINCALSRAVERYKDDLPLLLKVYKEKYYTEKTFDNVENFYDSVNNVPKEFLRLIRGKSINGICDELDGKSILILGYGREGKVAFDFIKKYVDYTDLCIADKNEITASELAGIKTVFGEKYLDEIKNYDVVIKSPGIALLDKISESERQKITSQTALFIEYFEGKIIGVTGTKGKSTTTSLIYHILKENGYDTRLLGNIGIPALTQIESLNKNSVVALELSCHQLEYVKASPEIAILLNVFEEHLDHYVNLEAYRDAKYNIFKYQTENDTLIVNVDLNLPECKAKKILTSNRLVSADEYVYVDDKLNISAFGESLCVPVNEVKTHLLGIHNVYNIGIALAACKAVGVPLSVGLKSVESFNGLEHRLEYVGTVGGVKFYNDSICTIPAATIAAVNCFDKVDTLLLGGMDRGISYDELASWLNTSNIDNIIFMPDSGLRIMNLMDKNCGKNLIAVTDLNEAVSKAKEVTKDGGICLLSPASASYGFFKNFEERGKVYKQLVLGVL